MGTCVLDRTQQNPGSNSGLEEADRAIKEDHERKAMDGNCPIILKTAGSIKTSPFSMNARLLAAAIAFHWSSKKDWVRGRNLPGENV